MSTWDGEISRLKDFFSFDILTSDILKLIVFMTRETSTLCRQPRRPTLQKPADWLFVKYFFPITSTITGQHVLVFHWRLGNKTIIEEIKLYLYDCAVSRQSRILLQDMCSHSDLRQ